MHKRWSYVLVLAGTVALVACAKQGEKDKKPESQAHAAPVTVVQAQPLTMEAVQQAVGQVDAQSTPQITAEVAGPVAQVLVDVGHKVQVGQTLANLESKDQELALRAAEAESRRLQSQQENQERTLKRLETLLQQGYVTSSQVDDARTLLATLREQSEAASAQLAIARRNLEKTHLTATVAGVIQTRWVSPGDYVSTGKPLFQLVGSVPTRVHLPFPEVLAAKLRVGQMVRMQSPVDPGRTYTARVADIRPMISAANRALDVIVDSPESLGWPAGASVNAEVVTAVRKDAITVPEQCLVQRPAGVVIYVVRDNKAEARAVEAGLRRDGRVEILKGLARGEAVVLDGAGFLTDGAPVQVKTQ